MDKDPTRKPTKQDAILLSGFAEPGFEDKVERTGAKIEKTQAHTDTDYTSSDPDALAQLRSTPEYKAAFKRAAKQYKAASNYAITRDQRLEFAFSGSAGAMADVGVGEFGRAHEAATITDDPARLAQREALEEEARKRGLLGITKEP